MYIESQKDRVKLVNGARRHEQDSSLRWATQDGLERLPAMDHGRLVRSAQPQFVADQEEYEFLTGQIVKQTKLLRSLAETDHYGSQHRADRGGVCWADTSQSIPVRTRSVWAA